MGPTVLVGCLQAAATILFKYDVGWLCSMCGGDEKCVFRL
jgi:hypothetical protein